jgi:hypothetical protein
MTFQTGPGVLGLDDDQNYRDFGELLAAAGIPIDTREARGIEMARVPHDPRVHRRRCERGHPMHDVG